MSAIYLRLFGGAQLSAHGSGSDGPINLAPKPLALLAYLALAGSDGRPIRRDTLLALFWPELPTSRARAALRQVLFRLRGALGRGALRTDREVVALAPDVLSCDVVEFERALGHGDRSVALALYRGELLDGFYVGGMSVALEAWMDRERARHRRDAVQACWGLVDQAEGAHDATAATRFARRAVALDPDDERAVRRLIQLLDRVGDRAGALRTADELVRRMAEEYGAEPSTETRALVAEIRAPGAGDAAVRKALPATTADDVESGSVRKMAASWRPSDVRPSSAAPSTRVATPSPEQSPRRTSLHGRSTRPAAFPAAAMLAMLFALVTGGFLAAEGWNSARRSGAGPPSLVPPGVAITSPVARRLYEEGLDRYHAGDQHEAGRLLEAALAEDSSCAMCAYYASVAYAGLDDTASVQMVRLAVRLASAAPGPERLLIRYGWADATNSPDRLAIAESLAERYPAWPEAQLAAGHALMMASEFLPATQHLQLAIAEASARDARQVRACSACTAEMLLVRSYESADSLLAALRTARHWVRAYPWSRDAWLQLAHTLAKLGRFDAARAALDSSTNRAVGSSDDPIERAEIELRAGDFSVADRLLRSLAQTGNANSRVDAIWWLVISLRQQGRLTEALSLAEGPLRSAEAAETMGPGSALVAKGQVLFELGRYREAAVAFEARASAAYRSGPTSGGDIARQRVWYLTQAGSALAAAGDTAALASLADTVEAWGLKSGFSRDGRLHEYLRGLLWMARREPDRAVAAFRRAISSESEEFSRLDLQFANALLTLNRPREAVLVLRNSLAGSIEGGNFYVTRTELQELLGEAYDAAGRSDSASVYYTRVLDAWRRADPQLRPAVARIRARVYKDRRHLAARR